MKRKLLALAFSGLAVASWADVVSPLLIEAHRNCDLVVEATGVDPVSSAKIKEALKKKGFQLVSDFAAIQNAEFAFHGSVDRVGPFPKALSVNILRKVGDVEYVYINGEDVGFPHLEPRAVFKMIHLVEAAPRCQMSL